MMPLGNAFIVVLAYPNEFISIANITSIDTKIINSIIILIFYILQIFIYKDQIIKFIPLFSLIPAVFFFLFLIIALLSLIFLFLYIFHNLFFLLKILSFQI